MNQMVSGLESSQFHVLFLLVLSSLYTFRTDSVLVTLVQYRGKKKKRKTHFVREIEKDIIHALLLLQHLKVTVQRTVWINSAQIKTQQ